MSIPFTQKTSSIVLSSDFALDVISNINGNFSIYDEQFETILGVCNQDPVSSLTGGLMGCKCIRKTPCGDDCVICGEPYFLMPGSGFLYGNGEEVNWQGNFVPCTLPTISRTTNEIDYVSISNGGLSEVFTIRQAVVIFNVPFNNSGISTPFTTISSGSFSVPNFILGKTMGVQITGFVKVRSSTTAGNVTTGRISISGIELTMSEVANQEIGTNPIIENINYGTMILPDQTGTIPYEIEYKDVQNYTGVGVAGFLQEAVIYVDTVIQRLC